jgi:hypothetical protein
MVEVANRADAADAFLGRVVAFSIKAPHTPLDIKRQLLERKTEWWFTDLFDLFDLSRQKNALVDKRALPVWMPAGPGSTPECPLVLKQVRESREFRRYSF